MDPVLDESIYNAAYVRALFNRMSRSYERMNIIMSFGFSSRWRRNLMQLIPRPSEVSDVVDLMSGMGETWGQVRRRFPQARIQALDFSPEMTRHSQEKNERRFGSSVVIHCDDIFSSTLATEGFDAVVCAYGLKTLDEEQSRRLGVELVRILRPGGRFAFIEVTQPPNAVLRALYDVYLSLVLPIAGRILISDPTEYRMLYRYVRDYGRGERSLDGLTHPELSVTRKLHFFGCATSFSGERLSAQNPEVLRR
ncbi:MAG TPA: class I SAM-dependent methyltransferase [Pseudolysinimonas sp.]|nr:class I SAM-dependent methyltransferase [Pseudolysinimonas sp.]